MHAPEFSPGFDASDNDPDRRPVDETKVRLIVDASLDHGHSDLIAERMAVVGGEVRCDAGYVGDMDVGAALEIVRMAEVLRWGIWKT